jgi:hypothetical protein
MMVKRHVLALTAIVGVMAGAHAQDNGPPSTVFDAMARTRTDTRPVRFRFFCSSNGGPNVTGVLAVELEVPQFEQLKPLFDFGPFEGPDANAGALTQLRAAGPRSTAGNRFSAAGSIIPSGTSEAFMLGIDASRREPGPLHRLAAALRPLTEGPAQLVWQQGNAKPGGAPLVATLVLDAARSQQLKTGLGPCLGAR